MIVCSNGISLLWAVAPLVGMGKYDIEPFGFGCAVSWIATNTGKIRKDAKNCLSLVN